MRKTLNQRFEDKVDRSGDCHIWTASVSTDGYGQIGASVDGTQKNLSAHRLAYEWASDVKRFIAFGTVNGGLTSIGRS